MPSAPKDKSRNQAQKPETAPVAPVTPVAPVPNASPADMPFKDAVKAALAKKKSGAGWPKDPSTKHRMGKT